MNVYYSIPFAQKHIQHIHTYIVVDVVVVVEVTPKYAKGCIDF